MPFAYSPFSAEAHQYNITEELQVNALLPVVTA
jgi:hypothetical protein